MVKPRPQPRAHDDNTGGATTPPVSSGGGGIRKRVNVPVESRVLPIAGELGKIVNAVNADAGPGAPYILASQRSFNAGFCRTDILALDLALGGGWRLSRGAMLYGERSAGKSTVSLLTAAEMQRKFPDQYVVYIDIEGTFDRSWARKLGVDLNRIIIVEPDTGEDAVNQADAVTRALNTSLVITDSIAMLSPSKEIDGAAEDELPGLQARLVTKFLRKVNNAVLRERKRGHFPLILHLNQWRMKIGAYGDPRSLPGGKALEFAATQQVEIKNKEHKNESKSQKDETAGQVMFNEHNIIISKNKSGGPLREAAFKFIRTPHDGMPEGFVDQAASTAKRGLAAAVFDGTDQWFSHSRYGKWNGAGKYTEWCLEHPDEARLIRAEIVTAYMKKWDIGQ